MEDDKFKTDRMPREEAVYLHYVQLALATRGLVCAAENQADRERWAIDSASELLGQLTLLNAARGNVVVDSDHTTPE